MTTTTISVADNFSKYPGARYISDGKFSGEQFYKELLQPKLKKIWNVEDNNLMIDFDGTLGYASSFISEICIRLVKEFKDRKKIKEKIIFKSDDEPLLISTIFKFIEEVQ